MVSKDLIRRFDLQDDELDSQIANILGDTESTAFADLIDPNAGSVERDQIVPARVLKIDDENGFVLVDIGGKTKAPIALS